MELGKKGRNAQRENGEKEDLGEDPRRHQGQDGALVEPVTSVDDLEESASAWVPEAFALVVALGTFAGAFALVALAFVLAFEPEAPAIEEVAAGFRVQEPEVDVRDLRRQWGQHNRVAGWQEG
jgi:hypothetical protein